MINFPGTIEEAWLKMPGHRIKDIIQRLKEYKKNDSNQCPLMSSKKR
jgi:hypothetical protein